MANEDIIIENAKIYLEIQQWYQDNNIIAVVKRQMEQRMKDEFMGVSPELRRLK